MSSDDFAIWWSEDILEARSDGFLLMKTLETADEQQPLLLNSTEKLLHCLYPKMDKEVIFQQKGHMGGQEILLNEFVTQTNGESLEMSVTINQSRNNESENDTPPEEYRPYQTFTRSKDLSNHIQSALSDIEHYRHRLRRYKDEPKASRQEAKVRALEKQQKFLSQRLEKTENNLSGVNDSMDVDGDDDDDGLDEVDEIYQAERGLLRMVRTVNSIRACLPYLLPILNHPRRLDKKLFIKNTKWNTKKRSMCWLLGNGSFDVTSKKISETSLRDIEVILKTYIDISVAHDVSQDPLGAPDFWCNKWLRELQKKSKPEILNPLSILTNHSQQKPEKIEDIARNLDKKFLSTFDKDAPKVQKGYNEAINHLRDRILKILKKQYPNVRISIYGSCLSNLSLGKGSDVDCSLWFPEAAALKEGFQKGQIDAQTYERKMKNFVFKVFHKLRNNRNEFKDMEAIAWARVPVIKGTMLGTGNPHSKDGSINFDICFLNDIAVANSGLLREYSLVDPRVRSLMMAVKKWAKERKINSAKDGTISSYAWINLVIFYLQVIGFVPNLQNRELMEKIGISLDPSSYWHCVNNLDTCFGRWIQVRKTKVWKRPLEYDKMPVSILLYGFFEFYSHRFPLALRSISIKRGDMSMPKLVFRKASLFFSIEDCFETYDSHCPHDLGTPAADNGLRAILEYLADAETQLQGLLLGKVENEDTFWPATNPDVEQKSKAKSEPNRNRNKNRKRGKPAPTGGNPQNASKKGGNKVRPKGKDRKKKLPEV